MVLLFKRRLSDYLKGVTFILSARKTEASLTCQFLNWTTPPYTKRQLPLVTLDHHLNELGTPCSVQESHRPEGSRPLLLSLTDSTLCDLASGVFPASASNYDPSMHSMLPLVAYLQAILFPRSSTYTKRHEHKEPPRSPTKRQCLPRSSLINAGRPEKTCCDTL